MQTAQQQEAKLLYFQTNLSKSEIADSLNINRTHLHYWIQEGNWERLKRSATHLPSLLAENIYHIIARLTEHLLSERRIMTPVTYKEADTLHKLTLTISKLKNRSTLNENMESFAFFLEKLKKKDTKLADTVMPHIDEYLSERANIYARDLQPASFNAQGLIPHQEPDTREAQLDMKDLFDWSNEQLTKVDVSELESLASQDNPNLYNRPSAGTQTTQRHSKDTPHPTKAEEPAPDPIAAFQKKYNIQELSEEEITSRRSILAETERLLEKYHKPNNPPSNTSSAA